MRKLRQGWKRDVLRISVIVVFLHIKANRCILEDVQRRNRSCEIGTSIVTGMCNVGLAIASTLEYGITSSPEHQYKYGLVSPLSDFLCVKEAHSIREYSCGNYSNNDNDDERLGSFSMFRVCLNTVVNGDFDVNETKILNFAKSLNIDQLMESEKAIFFTFHQLVNV